MIDRRLSSRACLGPILALAAACGESPAAAPAAAGEVRGAPMRSVPRNAASKAATTDESVSPGPGGAPGPGETVVETAGETAGKQDEDALSKRFRSLSFPELSGYDYAQPTAAELAAGKEALVASFERRVPEGIRALAGQKIAIEGFMQPIDSDQQGVLSFALVHNAVGCCFGTFPRMNEWVLVEMEGGARAEYFSAEPATVYGTLEVGELIEDGYVESLYRMRAERVFGTF